MFPRSLYFLGSVNYMIQIRFEGRLLSYTKPHCICYQKGRLFIAQINYRVGFLDEQDNCFKFTCLNFVAVNNN